MELTVSEISLLWVIRNDGIERNFSVNACCTKTKVYSTFVLEKVDNCMRFWYIVYVKYY